MRSQASTGPPAWPGDRSAPAGGEPAGQSQDHRRLQPQPAVARDLGEFDRSLGQAVDPVKQRHKDPPQPGRFPIRAQVIDPDTEMVQQRHGQVAAIQFRQVLGAILHVIEDLQRDTERIG